ncbi:hypothetical protein [Streptomyces sp. NPDC020965]|uniref:hypothetical protein n=1 Tax=Streptomyces sp. NPDC020965 TaxID=3365105 RepID=UPI0037AA9B30
MPDSADWAGEVLEAGILRALVRPVLRSEAAASPGTLFGVAAVSPGAKGLNMLGRYSFQLPELLDGLRPLRDPATPGEE